VNYGLYPADSEEALSFYASDNMDLDPDVTAVIVDFEGNEISVSSGDDLPSVCGLYTLSVTATDDAGNSASKSVIFIVYDPSVGFATGGGWIIPEPEEGNCKANFCFVVKYNKESKTPGGNLEFQYNFRNINLKSIEIYWLVISNNKAMFQGTATINGQGLYTFRVQATDGDLTGDQPDNFKIKIWEGTDTEADPIHNYYDDLAGGNIKIHKK
jgi:hypothetical protein